MLAVAGCFFRGDCVDGRICAVVTGKIQLLDDMELLVAVIA